MALQFGKDLSHYQLQEEGKTGQWAGAIACEIAMEVGLAIVSGGVYTAARAGDLGVDVARFISRLENLMPSNVIRRVLDTDGDGRIDLDPSNPDVVEAFPSCRTGGGNSFPADTLVVLGDGSLRAISDLTVGDEVVSYDEHVGQWNTNVVTAAWSATHADALVTIGIAGGGFTSTSDHLVWSESDRTWSEADELLPGDTVLTPAGPETVLTTTSNVTGDGTVWDITVANDHNFLVTNPANGPPVLVHNCPPELTTDRFGDPILKTVDENGVEWVLTEKNRLIQTRPDGTVIIEDEFGRIWTKTDDGVFGEDGTRLVDGGDNDLRTPEQIAERVAEIFDLENDGADIVLGRIPDTKKSDAIDGEFRFDVEDWSKELNDAVIDRIIADGDPVKLVTDPSDYIELIRRSANDPLFVPNADEKALLDSVYARELEQLLDSGWVEIEIDGDWVIRDALAPERLQHGTRHLTEEGLLPNWSGSSSPDLIRSTLAPILSRPSHVYSHTLRDGNSVRGYIGEVDGQVVTVQVYTSGPNVGKIATSYVPSVEQLKGWGVDP